MKRNLLYLLPLIVAFASGCLSHKNDGPTPNIPTGTFSGQFKLLHLHGSTGIVDTLKANVKLQMQTNGTYSVTGDTATVHAGSHGNYATDYYYTHIAFADKTLPSTLTPVKAHLSGVYDYTYDGSTLKMVTYGPLDTLAFFYNLQKTSN